MPVIMNEDETDTQYMCDICGVEIQDPKGSFFY